LARTLYLQHIPEDGTWVPKNIGDYIRKNCFALKSTFVGKFID